VRIYGSDAAVYPVLAGKAGQCLSCPELCDSCTVEDALNEECGTCLANTVKTDENTCVNKKCSKFNIGTVSPGILGLLCLEPNPFYYIVTPSNV